MIFSLTDAFRWFQGGNKKKKPAFTTEKEAYDFCRNLYNKSGGVAPELKRAYDFYNKNLDEDCDRPFEPSTNQNKSNCIQG